MQLNSELVFDKSLNLALNRSGIMIQNRTLNRKKIRIYKIL